MKKTYLVIIVMCFVLQASGRKKTDAQEANIKGRVKEATEVKYSCPKNVIYSCILRTPPDPKYVTARTTHSLDEHGNQVLSTYYNSQDQLVTNRYCRYDTYNNKTESVVRGSDGSLLSRTVYKYNEKGYPVETDYYNKKDSLYNIKKWDEWFFYSKDKYHYAGNGRQVMHNAYEESGFLVERNASLVKPDTLYDKSGRVAMTTFIYGSGTVPGYKKYNYDKKGNLVEVDYTKSGETLTTPVNMYIYDDSDNLITEIEDNPNGIHDNKQTFLYDEQGNKTEARYYRWSGGEGYYLSRLMHYDPAGNEIEESSFNMGGGFLSRYTKVYDAKGNILCSRKYDKDSTVENVTTYRYEDFDKMGNWHNMISWTEEEDFSYPKVYTTNREIKYYQ